MTAPRSLMPPAGRLPLFPLRTVLFPDGLLSLKVFEARYLDLISGCLREGSGFGVVALTQGAEVQQAGSGVAFEAVGCMAEVLEVDAEQAGLLQVRCRGVRRFRGSEFSQASGGLWSAAAQLIDGDANLAPEAGQIDATRSLANAIGALASRGAHPFLEPYRFDEAGWVANRWCELLPISLEARQRLMELDDPLLRLRLVDEYLRDKGLVPGSGSSGPLN